jgi:predicted O-methyltransferase YrrM
VQVIALDIDKEAYEIGAPFIVKAGVAHKVDFRDGPAMDGIDMLLKDVRWSFSFVSLHL